MSSTLPLLLSLADELESLTTQTYPDDFGLGFYPHRHYNRNPSQPSLQLSLPAHNFLEKPRTRRRSYDLKPSLNIANNSNTTSTFYNHDGFQVSMNVQDFQYEDLSVKTKNNSVIVEGKHDEREDEHGLISRQFVRKYLLPEGCNTNDATSALSSDGILTIRVPHSQNNISVCNEKTIEIEETGEKHPIDEDDTNKGLDNVDVHNDDIYSYGDESVNRDNIWKMCRKSE